MVSHIPHETQVAVIAYRLKNSLRATAAKFDITPYTVKKIIACNPELVKKLVKSAGNN